MTLRFVVDDGGGADNNLPRHRLHGTRPLTRGAGLLGPKLDQLLPQRLLDRPLDQRLSRIDGDLLEGVEVEIEARPLLAERPTRHDWFIRVSCG